MSLRARFIQFAVGASCRDAACRRAKVDARRRVSSTSLSRLASVRRRAAACGADHGGRDRDRGGRVVPVSPRHGGAAARRRASASMLLRCVALAGLLVFFLGIERRTTTEVVHNSQVAVLVDVSQSMGLSDSDEPATAGAANAHRRSGRRAGRQPADRRTAADARRERGALRSEVEPVVTLPKSQESRVESQEPEVRSDPSCSTLDPRLSTRSTGRPSCSRAGRRRGLGRRWPISCGCIATRRWPA